MDGTSDQATRLAAAFDRMGENVDLVEDSRRRPIVVVLRKAFQFDDVRPILSAAQRRRTIDGVPPENKMFVYPEGNFSGSRYPEKVREVLDVAVRASLQRDDVAAIRVCGSEVATTAEAGDAPPHTDFPGNLADPPLERIHGLNVHLTMSGTAQVSFGLMPDIEAVQSVAASLRAATEAGQTQKEINDSLFQLFGAHMNDEIEPVHLECGDVVLFQARLHARKRMLPVIHRFRTTSASRWHTAFMPNADDRSTVERARTDSIEP